MPALQVFILLLCTYLITYSGVPISDDEHLFAAASQNLVVVGGFNANQLIGNQRIMGTYANIGPLHPLIGSLIYRLVSWTNKIGAVQALYFLAPFYTALNGALIYVYGITRKYSLKTSIIAALIFGLATIAWPYTQTFYREPLAALLCLSAYLVFNLLVEGKNPKKIQAAGWVLFGGLLLSGILTKFYIILLFPLFALRYCAERRKLNRVDLIPIISVTIGALVFFFLWFISDWGNLSRLSVDFIISSVRKFLKVAPSLVSIRMIPQILGMLFSPSKGLLVYSPILITSFVILRYKKLRQRENLLIPLGGLIVFLAIQLYVYQNEWWNISWGTRFFLPILPLLVISCLPALEAGISSHNKSARMILFLLFVLGLVIQVGGTAVSDAEYLKYIYTQGQITDLGNSIWEVKLMPAILHWQLLFSGADLRFAAIRNFRFAPILISMMVLILIGILVWVWRHLWRLISDNPQPPTPQSILMASWAGIYLIVLVPVMLLISYRFDPLYFSGYQNLPAVIDHLEAEIEPADVLIVDGYQRPAWYHLMNYGRLPVSWYSLSEDSTYWPETMNTIHKLNKQQGNFWLLLEGESVSRNSSVLEFFEGLEKTCEKPQEITISGIADYQIYWCKSDRE